MKIKKFSFAVIVGAILLFAGCRSTKIISPVTNSFYTDVVEVNGGKIRGMYSEDGLVEIYAGIPYAAPPVGKLRWKEPQNVEPWEGVKDCVSFAPMAMQKRNSAIYDFLADDIVLKKRDRTRNAPMSEDCLYLNVYAPTGFNPNSDEKLPVLMYIHGGSLRGGSSYFESYDGESIAHDGVVVVTIAYRLGVFGYFAHEDLAKESQNGTTGNYGLLDQIKALEWVYENIGSFGGDNQCITIAGESAGSSSVNAVCASPLAKGMVKRAIAESSGLVIPVPPHTFRTMEDAQKTGNAIMNEFGCSSIDELRNVNAEILIKTKYENTAMTLDGYALVESVWDTYKNSRNNEEALLNGYNYHDGDLFALGSGITSVKKYREVLQRTFGDYTDEVIRLFPAKNGNEARKQYYHIFSAVTFGYQHRNWSNVLASHNVPVYEYFFTMQNKCLSDHHSGEMIYAYGNVPDTRYYTKADYDLERIMKSYWVNFIKTGNPNGVGLPEWKTVNEMPGYVIELGSNIKMRPEEWHELYKVIDKVKLASYGGEYPPQGE